MDITKYVSKDTLDETLTDFYADFENYDSGIQDVEIESGDMVGWTWNGVKYVGILRGILRGNPAHNDGFN